MTVLMVGLGAVALVLPGLGAAAALRGSPRSFVALDTAAILFGLVSVATGLGTSAAVGALHVAAGASLAQFEGHIAPGGIVASVGSLAALGLMAVRLSVTAFRARRGRHSAHAERWLGQHHDLGDHELVVLPASAPVAYSVDGSPPQVVISEGLTECFDAELVAFVVDHERAHLRGGHRRALLAAALVDGVFGWSSAVAKSTAALRLAVERTADEAAAGTDPRRRDRLGATMRSLGDLSRLPQGAAEQVQHRARLLVQPPAPRAVAFPLVASGGLVALTLVGAALTGHVAGGDLPALLALLG